MSTVSLSKIKFNWRGAWSYNNSYALNDAVSYNGGSFVCIADVTPTLSELITQENYNGLFQTEVTADTITRNSAGLRTRVANRLAPMFSGAADDNTTFVVGWNGSAYTFSGVAGTNPTLTLGMGRTYFFDCSSLPNTASFTLRNASNNNTENPIGAQFNNVNVGVDSTSTAVTTGNNAVPFSKVVRYTVPFFPKEQRKTIVYQSADNSAVLGTINLVDPTELTEVNTRYWKRILGEADSASMQHRGDIFARGATGELDIEPGYTNYVLESKSAFPSGTVFQITSPTSAGAGAYTIEVRSPVYNGALQGPLSGNNPTLQLVRGATYYFDVRTVTSDHPFALRTASGSTTDIVGATNNDETAGIHRGSTNTIITYTVPSDAPASLVYQCTNHASMLGTINTTGTTVDLSWREPDGKKHQTVRASNRTPISAINANNRPTLAEQPFGILPMNNRGTPAGFRAAMFTVMPDRRSLKSFGYNAQGTLGYAHFPDSINETTYPGQRYSHAQYCQFYPWFDNDEYISYVRCNNGAAIVVTTKGRVYFAGYNGYGQFGFGHTRNTVVFERNDHFGPGTGRTAKDVQFGTNHGASDGNISAIYVHTQEGELWAAGYNGYGNLGQNDTTNRSFFVQIGLTTFMAGGATVVGYQYSTNTAVSDNNVIVWDSLGRIWGWGSNNSFTLGLGNQSQQNIPQRLVNLESAVTAGSTIVDVMMNYDTSDGRNVTAVLMSDGKVYVTGRSNHGQLGIGGAESQQLTTWQVITMPAGKSFRRLACGGGTANTFYAITTDNMLYAWGYNGQRQIGDATTTNRTTAVECSAMPLGFQGNITDIYVQGNNGSGTVIWVKATIDGRARWASWGYYSGGVTCHSDRYLPDVWDAAVDPREITQVLPNMGQDIVEIAYNWYSTANQAWYFVNSVGEVFFVGYTDTYFRDNTIDTTLYSAGSGYRFQYPRLVTNVQRGY